MNFSGEHNPHNVAGLIKLYLRELSEPLMTYALYDPLMVANRMCCRPLCCALLICARSFF